LVPIEGGEEHPITHPSRLNRHFIPRFSPDGHRLAYASCVGDFACDIEVVELGADLLPRSPPTRVVHARGVNGLAWTRDGLSLVYGTLDGSGTLGGLYRVGVAADGKPERIELAGTGAGDPATTASRDRLVFRRNLIDLDIYRFQPGRPSEAVAA